MSTTRSIAHTISSTVSSSTTACAAAEGYISRLISFFISSPTEALWPAIMRSVEVYPQPEEPIRQH